MIRHSQIGSPLLPHLNPIEFEVEAVDRLEAIAGLDVLGISQHAAVHGDLEVIFLLTYEGVVRQGEVKTFISVDAIGGHWAREGGRDGSVNIFILSYCTFSTIVLALLELNM